MLFRRGGTDAREAVEHIDKAMAITPNNPYALSVGSQIHRIHGIESLALKLERGKLGKHGLRWTITGPDKWSHNAPGKTRQVDIKRATLTETPNTLALAPLSVTLYALPLQ